MARGPARQRLLLVGATVVLIDQVTKRSIRDAIGPGADRHQIDLLGSFISLRYVENRGVSFGMLADRPALAGALVAAVAILFGIVLVRRADWSARALLAAGLVMGGAIGNGIDRVRFGYVTDFIAVGNWPVFNVADGAITVGAIMLVWMAFTDRPAGDLPGTDLNP